jgi:hypothetical protein
MYKSDRVFINLPSQSHKISKIKHEFILPRTQRSVNKFAFAMCQMLRNARAEGYLEIDGNNYEESRVSVLMKVMTPADLDHLDYELKYRPGVKDYSYRQNEIIYFRLYGVFCLVQSIINPRKPFLICNYFNKS